MYLYRSSVAEVVILCPEYLHLYRSSVAELVLLCPEYVGWKHPKPFILTELGPKVDGMPFDGLVRFCATLQSTAVRRCLLIGRQLLRQVTRSWRGTLSRRNACTRRARTVGSRSTSRCRSRTPAPASHMTPWTRSSGRRGLGNAKLASSSCPPHG